VMAKKKKAKKAAERKSGGSGIYPSPKTLDDSVQAFESTHNISFEEAALLRYYLVCGNREKANQLMKEKKLDLKKAKSIVQAFNRIRK